MKNLLEAFLHDPANIQIFGIIIFILTVFIAWTTGRISAELKFRRLLKTERADAVNRSKAVLSGLAAEQVAPFLPDFPCNPSDCRFVGKPVDFVAFSGASEGEIKEVVFIEVKTGTSRLTKREQEIKNCIEEKKVRYAEYRIDLPQR
ncbi:Holliday junction resolvase-like protein [Treponema berlinense]|uniref:Holliday junction resolvase-like protein n=1 Tax=Treponema berlinense TaxID=225004 RepID=UPI0026E9E4D0|nr:Holliday junction resolvase-like protein [Treponema berlinense]